MARACSLSHILYPQASVITKSLPINIFIKSFDFVRACLPRVWLEPVVSHAYFPLRRQHFTKSLTISSCIQKNKALSYNLINYNKNQINEVLYI
ncbi:hypothetical protein B2G86_10930 [Mammaliicoccus fleurettii]|nr:hypothetical protein B2G86_10930 [Mammaliicoccus fleurettii]